MTEETIVVPVDLTTCDRELIHIPGAIQPHGVLLALQEPDLTILLTSENTEKYLGRPPAELLNQPVEILFDESERAFLKQHLTSADIGHSNPLQITVHAGDQHRLFDGIVHRRDGLLILELEHPRTEREVESPLNPPLDFHYRLVRQAMSRMHAASRLQDVCDILAEEVRRFSGFDRVMIYKFHEDAHGEVISEAMAPGQEPYLGLHYPASDIPAQARRLYCLNWLRLIVDAGYEPVHLTPPHHPFTQQPFDLSHTVLRSVSPVHLQYLHNMGVVASMSISLLKGEQLWGLIACHHRSPRFVPYEIRAACELLGVVMSFQLTTKEQSEDAAYQNELRILHTRLLHRVVEGDLIQGLTQDEQSLLKLVNAGGSAILFGGQYRLVGQTPSQAEIEALVKWLQGRADLNLFYTDCLSSFYPPAKDLTMASGFLAIPLSKIRGDYILFFRPELVQTVNWAGNPDKPVEISDEATRLTPRKSFELWQETVRHKSAPWKADELDIAQELKNSLISFIIQRAEDLLRLNEDLQRSNAELDAFAYVASHDLKEPLRGIQAYALYLADRYAGALDDETQRQMAGLMRMTQRMNELLDSLLHFSRVGRLELIREPVDLDEVLQEALDMVSTRREEASGQVRLPRPLPLVYGDRVRIREVFLNLISNAFKYNDKAERWVEVGFIEMPGRPTCFYVRDNGIGIQSRFHDRIFEMFKRLHGRDEYGGGTGAGLTIVKKIVEWHGGRIWVESTVGEGSVFFFTLEGEMY